MVKVTSMSWLHNHAVVFAWNDYVVLIVNFTFWCNARTIGQNTPYNQTLGDRKLSLAFYPILMNDIVIVFGHGYDIHHLFKINVFHTWKLLKKYNFKMKWNYNIVVENIITSRKCTKLILLPT
jgi:hypothetical protein